MPSPQSRQLESPWSTHQKLQIHSGEHSHIILHRSGSGVVRLYRCRHRSGSGVVTGCTPQGSHRSGSGAVTLVVTPCFGMQAMADMDKMKMDTAAKREWMNDNAKRLAELARPTQGACCTAQGGRFQEKCRCRGRFGCCDRLRHYGGLLRWKPMLCVEPWPGHLGAVHRLGLDTADPQAIQKQQEFNKQRHEVTGRDAGHRLDINSRRFEVCNARFVTRAIKGAYERRCLRAYAPPLQSRLALSGRNPRGRLTLPEPSWAGDAQTRPQCLMVEKSDTRAGAHVW